MPKLSKKQWIYVGVGVVAILAIYLYERSHASTAAATTPDSTGDTLGTEDTGGFGDSGGGGFGSTGTDLSGELSADEGAIAQNTADIGTLSGQAGIDPTTNQPYSSEISGITASLPQLIADAIPAPITGAAGAAGKNATLSKSQQHELTSVLASQKRTNATLKALQKKIANTPHQAKSQHPKAPHPNSSNHNHPSGTAGRSVAPSNHAAKTPPRSKPVQVPRPKPKPPPKKTAKHR